MILYKYLPSSRLDVLTASEIRFTQLGDFNDAFELQPNIDGLALPTEIEELVSRNFEEFVLDEYENHPEVHPFIGKEDFLSLARGKERLVTEVVNALQGDLVAPFLANTLRLTANQTLGALSLSEVHNHQLMWSHYAEGHRGYALGFDSSSSFFNRKITEDDALRHLRPIAYATAPPVLQFKTVTSADLFFTKGYEWQYEAEWRMLLPLSESSRTIPCEPFPIHLFQFPAEAVSQIIFGAKMTDENRSILKSFISSNTDYQHVSFWQASINTGSSTYEVCTYPI